MGNAPDTPTRRRALSWGLKAGALALAAWLVLRLLGGLEWADVAARLATARPAWLAAAVAALVLRMVIWDQRWREAIRRSGGLPSRPVTLAALLAAAAVNSITPTVRVVGGVLRGRWIGRSSGLSLGRAYGSVLFDQLAHQVVTGSVTVVALIGALLTTGRTAAGLGLAAAALAVVAAGGFWLGRRRGRRSELIRAFAERLVGRASAGGALERLVAHGREAIEVVATLLADVGLRGRAILLGVAFFLVNAAAQWLVFLALGEPVSAWVVLAVVSLGAAAGILVGTPGGLGAAEAAMIAGFTALGVDRVDATAASLLYRALHFAVVLGLGLPSLAWLELGSPARRDPSPAARPSAGEGG
ncbi:MAG TPA: lysylphosphatidylglycerol synthase transmembrane domain-containing protein [Thermoanaerobaculia bacterium]|nr:lysylphosphatidylglycerol synthase transmembrane domain-containing protein [Thermoanaerobaculia bacterium]